MRFQPKRWIPEFVITLAKVYASDRMDEDRLIETYRCLKKVCWAKINGVVVDVGKFGAAYEFLNELAGFLDPDREIYVWSVEELCASTEPIAFASLGLQLSSDVTVALEEIWPRLSLRGIVQIDAYGLGFHPGVKRATDEFLKDGRATLIESVPGIQARFRKFKES